MFDVSWTDHQRETVGERKNRKEAPKTTSANLDTRARRSSLLSAKSNDQVLDKSGLLKFFGSNMGSNKKGLQRTGSQSSSVSRTDEKATEDSRWTQNRGNGSQADFPNNNPSGLDPAAVNPSPLVTGPYLTDAELSSTSDLSESAFSGWTGKSAKTQSSWGSVDESLKSPGRIVQPLSMTSFVCQNTEITVTPRKNVKDIGVARIVQITAAGPPVPDFLDQQTASVPTSGSFEPVTPYPGQEKSTALVKKEVMQKGWPFTPRTEDGWKAPEIWGCASEDETKRPLTRKTTLRIADDFFREQVQEQMPARTTIELTHLQRNIRRMEAASPKIVLERLKEEWNEVADGSVYRELELEKQLWMLTALRSLKRKSSNVQMAADAALVQPVKVLSLYENHAAASSMSALSTAAEIHHLSTIPLSPKSYPNIHPLAVPGPTSQLPYASNNFVSIDAFNIPSLLPASSIPSMLRECHRTLTSSNSPASHTSPTTTNFSAITDALCTPRGGTLHLTILDPAPLAATLGPLLKAWLDSNLLLNLEKQFRCISPGRLFPIWLADAGLRAEGSTIVHVRFSACILPQTHLKGRPNSAMSSDTDGSAAFDATKQELRSIVGRMLWKEMWGSYVQGDRWWWEDDEIVEECERLETCWEYAVIEAVKEG